MKICPKCENEISDELFNRIVECFFCGNPDFSDITGRAPSKTGPRSKLELVFIASMGLIVGLAMQSVMAFRRSVEEGFASLGPLFVAILIYHRLQLEKLRRSALETPKEDEK